MHSIAELIPEDQSQKAQIIRAIQGELGNIHFEPQPSDPADVESVMHSLGALRLRTTQLTREAVERSAGLGTWRWVIEPILDQPVALVFGILSVGLILLGRKKRPLIGYARE